MKLKSPRILTKYLEYFFWVYTTFTIISFIAIYYANFPLWPSFTIDGFNNFFNVFSGPIKFSTGWIALLAILLTVKRIEQTDEQIKLIASNNRFENFYKHREEFENSFIRFALIDKIILYEESHTKNRLIPPDKKLRPIGNKLTGEGRYFYTTFYSLTHHEYRGMFNEEIEKSISSINKYLEKLPKLENSNTDIEFEKITMQQCSAIVNELPNGIIKHINHMSALDTIEFKHSDESVSDFGFFVKLNIIYWGFLFMKQMMDNEGISSDEINNFINSYNVVRIEKNMFYT